jgi:hypothetical protein
MIRKAKAMQLQQLHNNQWVCQACVWVAAEAALVEADLVNRYKFREEGIRNGSLFLFATLDGVAD